MKASLMKASNLGSASSEVQQHMHWCIVLDIGVAIGHASTTQCLWQFVKIMPPQFFSWNRKTEPTGQGGGGGEEIGPLFLFNPLWVNGSLLASMGGEEAKRHKYNWIDFLSLGFFSQLILANYLWNHRWRRGWSTSVPSPMLRPSSWMCSSPRK